MRHSYPLSFETVGVLFSDTGQRSDQKSAAAVERFAANQVRFLFKTNVF